MKKVLWAPAGIVGALLLGGCGEKSPIVDAPMPAEISKTIPAETLHLDFAWGTALLSQIEGAGSGSEDGELTVRVQTPGRVGDSAFLQSPTGDSAAEAPVYVDRTFAVRRWDDPEGMGISIQIRDERGRALYELGARNGSNGGVLFERAGNQRLEVFASVLSDGRRQERYQFDDGTKTLIATWVEGADPDPRFHALGVAAAGLAGSAEARLLSSLLSDSRFASWLAESTKSSGDAHAQYMPLEFELACDIIEECRREICEDHPGHPLCVGCTVGSAICSILRILWP